MPALAAIETRNRSGDVFSCNAAAVTSPGQLVTLARTAKSSASWDSVALSRTTDCTSDLVTRPHDEAGRAGNNDCSWNRPRRYRTSRSVSKRLRCIPSQMDMLSRCAACMGIKGAQRRRLTFARRLFVRDGVASTSCMHPGCCNSTQPHKKPLYRYAYA